MSFIFTLQLFIASRLPNNNHVQPRYSHENNEINIMHLQVEFQTKLQLISQSTYTLKV